jgi:hypothetical protein
MPRSPWRWRSTPPLSPGSACGTSRPGWTPRWTANRPRSYRRRLDGEQEAHLVALACSAPPEGRKRWTLRLLADRLVELEVIESVSYETVRQALKQTGSSRG